MDIGSKIKMYREKYHYSQDELALKVFVSRQTISNWETNKSYPDIKSLIILSNIFRVSLDEFVKGDIEKMKKLVSDEKINEFNLISYIFTAELLIVILSAYPLFSIDGYLGIIIWLLILLLTMITAFKIEGFKKHNDIQTYKEIIAFVENKPLSYEETVLEKAKRTYQKIILALGTGLIAIIVFMIEVFVLKHI